MRGPSSSHTAGPFFIADSIRQLSLTDGERILSARINFDPSGSYARVYKNQGSDQGIAAGLLGRAMTHPAYAHAQDDIRKDRLFDLSFNIKPLQAASHPNDAEFELQIKQQDDSVRHENWRSVSIGGGMFQLTSLNGADLQISGAFYTTLVEVNSQRVVELTLAHIRQNDLLADFGVCSIFCSSNTIEVQAQKPLSLDVTANLQRLDDVVRVRQCKPAQYIIKDAAPLFESCSDILNAANQAPLYELAEQYEAKQLGLTKAEVRELFLRRLETMFASIDEALEQNIKGMKFLSPKASQLMASTHASAIASPVLNCAIAAALAAMESGTSRGIVVAAPTAGSAGIVPGIAYALLKNGFTKDDCVNLLEVAALAGAIVAQQATFAAEVAGCNAETGVSAAMAAVGLAHVMGATPQQAFDAASICMMNTMGLVCDPVNGEVEIPCHARNIGGVSHAISSVTAVLGGFEAVLPMDELIGSMMQVASKTHPDMLCTARGGCAVTATARELLKQKANN
ncbi:L-serine ammonia-lyase, iron-sulfur-dependent, subunit alpha [Pseudovibrio sp. Tun.PSC04-5.I4]|uniref:L-serine ammonia-lyase, iron-sulfur-dependent, subunit alpha n=1 Tax=Pseudovibrio sp. Tun.PSC04-5.I4 TaxID=1798213 RepID=UPI0013562F63|nr:L-serine ammonia-lyase, iron-sulfur-dependent, subunit alpha [Pseudovibrio sp. Tun.PSC04-5.I4]